MRDEFADQPADRQLSTADLAAAADRGALDPTANSSLMASPHGLE